MAITKPYTFVAGTKAKAVEVNTNFDKIYEEAGKLDRDISNIKSDIQDINTSKADVGGNATKTFKLANPEDSYDGVNKNYLENAISNVKDYISGYVITKDTDNSIIVSAGSCYDSTFTTMINSTGNITKENLTQSPSKTYYVYAISDNSGHNVDILIAEESVTPPRPEGYTLFRQIGNYTTDSDSKISDVIYYGVKPNSPSPIASIVEDYVSDNSWYRVWSNGYKEQGGIWNSGTITFLKPFVSTPQAMVTQYVNAVGPNNNPTVTTISSTQMTVYSERTLFWIAYGF